MADREIIVPRLSSWNFKKRERLLRDAAEQDLPTLTLAHKSRQMLADVVRQLTDRIDPPDGERNVATADGLLVRKLAAVQLGMICTRSVSASIALITSGYERESIGAIRPAVESLIRLNQVVAEEDGESARKIVRGRAPKDVKRIARKYVKGRTCDHGSRSLLACGPGFAWCPNQSRRHPALDRTKATARPSSTRMAAVPSGPDGHRDRRRTRRGVLSRGTDPPVATGPGDLLARSPTTAADVVGAPRRSPWQPPRRHRSFVMSDGVLTRSALLLVEA